MDRDLQQIAITAELSANPKVCRFVADRPLRDGEPASCRRRADAEGSPLLAALFAVAGVTEAFVMGNAVTLAQDGTRDWREAAAEVGAAIRGVLHSGEPTFSPGWAPTIPPGDEIRDRIEQVFALEINPQIASHGGFVRLVEVVGTTVKLEMGGGCQGCASSQLTLKNGIERAIRTAVPEVTEIVDVTDHGAGTNPFYR